MSKSPQRKTINNIITNIRQIASNISKDVSMAQPIVLPSPQPKQPKQDQNSSQTKSNKSDSIQIRLARSARITLPESDTIDETQPSPDLHEIAQGIQNAHVKVDEALRFMTSMKHKLDAEPLASKNEAVTSNKQGVIKVRSLVDQPKLYSQNPQQPKSVPDFQTPSLGALPLSLEDLKVSPRSTMAGSAPYFGHTDAPYFNPFVKSATSKSSEAFAGIAQKNQVFNTTSTVPSLNLGTNQNFIQMMKNQTGSNTKISPVYIPSTMPSSILAQQSSACDHNRLNQIISTIKHRDHGLPMQSKTNPHQPQSLNDLQFGSVNSLTSIHDQLARPNTVSHLSKPPLRSNWFITPNESNFHQVVPAPQNNAHLSHYASQNSLHEIRNRYRPNLTTTTTATTVYQHPPIYVNSYIGGGARTVGSFHSENQGDGEEFFRPRRLTFDEPRSMKNSPYMEEVKQRRPVQVESHHKVQKIMRRRSDIHKKQKVYEDMRNDEDSIMNKECCCEHRHQCHSRKVSKHSECGLNQVESSASSQSDEESFEEYIEYEQVKPKKVKQQQLCSNCQCQRAETQQTYRTHVDVGSGQVCGSQRRSNSRKQQQSLVVHNVPLNTKVNSNAIEEVEYQSQILRRNKSIDNTQPKTNVRRKTHITILKTRPVVEIQNNENLTQDNVQQSEKKQKVSFENLRKRDENQSVLQRQRAIQVNTKKVLEKRDSKNSLYDKEFVDQLAIDFPANGEKAREQTVFKTVAAQKTEIAKKPRRVPL